MVLGAHLKPLKKGAKDYIYDNRGGVAGNINPIASYDMKNNFKQEMGYDQELVERTLNLNKDEKLEAPSSADIFEKFLTKKL